MAKTKSKYQINITLDKEVYNALLDFRNRHGISLSKLCRVLVYSGLDKAEFLQKCGLIKPRKTFLGISRIINNELFLCGLIGRSLDFDAES